MCAMESKHFCHSAKDAFGLMTNNIVLFGIADGIGAIFTSLGRVFIALVTALIGFLIINYLPHYHGKV